MKIKLSVYIIILLSSNVFGQLKTDLSPMNAIHSPNSSDLGQYGDVPVSLYTGTAEIKVPIYSIEERGVKLDVDLQYNSRGVRVEDVPGWVGQNWMLNAGGLITRTVRGTAYDELNFFHGKEHLLQDPNNLNLVTLANMEWSTSLASTEVSNNYRPIFQRGYFYHTGKLNNSQWNSISYLNDLACKSYYQCDGINFQQFMSSGRWRMDLEPDLFTFNFMGHTGHFFLGQDGQWKVFSNSNLKVICDMSQDLSYPVPLINSAGTNSYPIRFPKTLNKITLVDDMGVKYIFNQTELTFNSILSHRPPYNNDSRCISTAFYLTSVIDANNNLLFNFEYEKGPWIGKFNVSYARSESFSSFSEGSVTNSSLIQYNPYWNWHLAGFGGHGQLILPSYLKKITTESGVVIDLTSTLVNNAIKYTRTENPLFDNRTERYYGMHPSGSLDLYFLYKQPDMITDIGYSGSTPIWDMLKNKKLTNIKIKDNSQNQINVDLNFIDTQGVRLYLNEVTFNNDKKYRLEYYNYWLPSFLNSSTDYMGYYNGRTFKLSIRPEDFNYWNTELPTMKSTHSENVKWGSLKKIIYPTGGYTEFDFEAHDYSKKLSSTNLLEQSSGIVGGLRIKRIKSFDNNNMIVKEYIYKKNINSNESSGNLLYNPLYYKNSGIINHSLLPNDLNNLRLVSNSINNLISMSTFMGVYIEYTDVIEKVTNLGYSHYKFSNYENFPDIEGISLINQAKPFVPKIDRSYERGKLLEKTIFSESNTLLKKSNYNYFANNSMLINAVNMNFGFYNRFYGSSTILWMLPFTTAYQIPYSDKTIIKETDETYLNTGILKVEKEYQYKRFPDLGGTIINNGSIFKTKEYIKASDSDYGLVTTSFYPFDFSTSVSNDLISNNNFPVLEELKERIQGDFISPNTAEIIEGKKIDFQVLPSSTGGNITIPKESFIKKGQNTYYKDFEVLNSDEKGNITCYRKDNGKYVSIIWGYNKTKPIAMIENLSYSSIPSTTITSLQNLSNLDIDNCRLSSCSEQNLRNGLLNLINTYPQAMIKAYTYDLLTGITSVIETNNQINYYEYDDLMRLQFIRNKNNEILEEFHYNLNPYIND
jgi:hypothetical protein